MTPGQLLLFSVAALAVGAAGFRVVWLWMAGALAGCGAALGSALWILLSGAEWEWRSAMVLGGEAIHLRLDGLSAFFLALAALLGGVGALYSTAYWRDSKHPESAPGGRVWWCFLLAFMGLTLASANGLHFLIAWELFALSAYFLVTRERHKPEVRAAGWLYLAASHAGTLCLFAFFAGLAARTGSWELGPMRDQPELASLFWLALLGFGLKAGVFPLHIWLPSAHASAPSHVSAIMSGVAIKMGVYGLVRFSGWLPLPPASGWVVAGLGAASAVLGVAFALGQHDLKRLLAYHSVENIGIILIGLGFAMIAVEHGNAAYGQLALAGGLLHVWNHGLFKGLLFLGAGSVMQGAGTGRMSRLGGLWRAMPWTAGLFVLGAAAISGLPPLNGFVSEWLLYLGLFEAVATDMGAVWMGISAGVLLGMTGALALACFVKVCGIVFLGVPRSDAAVRAHECAPRMRASMMVLGAGCVAIGLAPACFWPAVSGAVAAWRPVWADEGSPAPLVALGVAHAAAAGVAIFAVVVLGWRVRRNGVVREPTWDCGYAVPTGRMQYTAGSFAGIITGWFAWILRPRIRRRTPEGLLPPGALCEAHTPETVLEDVVEPAGRQVMRVSAAIRRLQHGRMSAYILYLLIGVVALALLAVWGGGS